MEPMEQPSDVEKPIQSPGSTRLHTIRIAPTAGTHEESHVQAADDAADEAHRVFNRKHHSYSDQSPTLKTQTFVGKVAACLSSSRFESGLSIVICLNMILIIAETDLTADGQAPPTWITTANISFLIVYFFECIFKIIVFGRAYFQDTWNWLDLLVVFSDVVLTFLNFFEGVERVSVMRVFRLIKLARAIRVVRQIWELKILLLGFKAAAKSIFFGMGMVLVMTIVWAILGVQLIHPVNSKIWEDTDCERCQNAFGSVWNASITIFQTVVAGDSWGLLAIPVMDSAWWTSIWFLVVLVTVQLAMLNLILAVIVERAADAREQEVKSVVLEKEESMHKSKLMLIEMCRELDTDGSGRISEEEFLEGFENNPQFAAALLGMEVYPEDIGLLFEVLDTKGTGEVTYVSFVNTLARLRTQMSQVILFTITELRKSISGMQHDLNDLKGKHQEIGVPFTASKAAKASDNTGFSLVQSTQVELEKDVAHQLEETSRELQRRFQEMQQEISRSFHNAFTTFVEVAKVGAQEHLEAVSKEVGVASRMDSQGLDERYVQLEGLQPDGTQEPPALDGPGPGSVRGKIQGIGYGPASRSTAALVDSKLPLAAVDPAP